MSKTKNDIAWENLFDKYNILDHINKNGFYEIESKVINTERESRLMAKVDQYANLPQIFKSNKLSILPVSRSKYVLGNFKTFENIKYDKNAETVFVDFPSEIQTIDKQNLYSEASALHCAYVSGIINDILQEDAFFTVGGRMSASSFDFAIKNTINNSKYNINVNNAQLEIDAGFESANSFLLVEAKNYSVDDFLIRQLYYPYRLWTGKVSKKVIPAFLTYSNDVFSFFLFDFENPTEYNSIKLLKQKNYIIAPEEIELEDIYNLLQKTQVLNEPTTVPFPQANKLWRVVDLMNLLAENDQTKDEITLNYAFDIRQTDYYTNAAIYLGVVEKYKNGNNEIAYRLSAKGEKIVKQKFKNKYLAIVECVLQHKIYNELLRRYFELGYPPTKDEVHEIMSKSYMHNVVPFSETFYRRAQSVTGWIDWILDLPNKSVTE